MQAFPPRLTFGVMARRLATAAVLLPVTAAWAADTDNAAVERVVVKATARFGFDDATLNAADREAMLAEVGKMKDVTWQTVTAVGHTDSVGRPAYNQRLAQRRAGAVKSYLIGNGLTASMVQTRAQAANAPVAPNTDEAGRAQNRRADVEFQGIRATAAASSTTSSTTSSR